MFHRMRWLLLAALLFVLVTPPTLHARDGDRVAFGRSITVGEDESAGSVVCMGCSIRMEGSSADVVAMGGSIIVDGATRGDVVAIRGKRAFGRKRIRSRRRGHHRWEVVASS